MDLIRHLNFITITIACLFIIPIISGMVQPFSRGRIERSLTSLMNNITLLISILLSVYFTRLILSDNQNDILTTLYQFFPSLESMISGKSIWVYIIFILILLLIIDGILHLITIPIYRYAIVPISTKLSRRVNAMNGFSRGMIGGIWQLPKAIWIVLVFSILFNLFSGFYGNSSLNQYAIQSTPYRLIEEKVVQPLLNTKIIKNIQVVLNDSFKSVQNKPSGQTGKTQLIKYFNGVTLDQAIRSNDEIDATAQKIASLGSDPKDQAYLLYKWVCSNIQYDNDKVAKISKDPSLVSSGAIVAYTSGSGICFDYATLYVAMCRAVGLKVRFITGLGFTGAAWGDHSWNQVYDPKKDTWINVDTTFGSAGFNYFDRPNFSQDHTDEQIQGEWQ